MEMSFDQWLAALADYGLMNADHVQLLRREFESREPAFDQTLADELIRRGQLTAFQAQCLLDRQPQSLVFDEYLILDPIGEGGMGQVFRAMHRHMEREVALKVMRPDAMRSTDLVERFRREVIAAARLSHPNIVRAYDAGARHGACYLVMEYIDGRNLRELAVAERMDVVTAVEYTVQAARGLEYAHRQDIIHRDIKPANLLLDRQGTVKILDMGIALLQTANEAVDKLAPTEARLTKTGIVIGSVDFMAPEQATAADKVDARSDIYSLGCSLFFLLTGREVFTGKTAIERVLAHHTVDIPSIVELRADVPSTLDHVIRKMIAKRAGDRFASMSEVIAALQASVAGGGPVTIVSSASSATVFDPKKQHSVARSPSSDALEKFLQARGVPDRFIDFDEEQEVFRKGGDLRMSVEEVDQILTHLCEQNQWSRETVVMQELEQQFERIVQQRGSLRQSDFDAAVRSAVDQHMRRKAAIEACLTQIVDRQWPVDEASSSWYSKKLEQYGLD